MLTFSIIVGLWAAIRCRRNGEPVLFVSLLAALLPFIAIFFLLKHHDNLASNSRLSSSRS